MVLAHMKNLMPILSEKSTDSFTFARWPHQHRFALTPAGKGTTFDFIGRKSWSEQGTLMVDLLAERNRNTDTSEQTYYRFYSVRRREWAGKIWREKMGG